MQSLQKIDQTKQAKPSWTTPKLTPIGQLSTFVLGDCGKISATHGDPGEPRKSVYLG